jgi:hypothetical protein
MPEQAFIVHQLKTRLRLKIPRKCHDEAFFALVAERLEALPEVMEVASNPLTGSVVINHSAKEQARLIEDIEALGMLGVSSNPASTQTPLPGQSSMGGFIERAARGMESGNGDFRTIAVLGLLGLAIYQFYRGNILGPALPLLLSALQLAQTPDSFSGSDQEADP